jgi:hypothetical protein
MLVDGRPRASRWVASGESEQFSGLGLPSRRAFPERWGIDPLLHFCEGNSPGEIRSERE